MIDKYLFYFYFIFLVSKCIFPWVLIHIHFESLILATFAFVSKSFALNTIIYERGQMVGWLRREGGGGGFKWGFPGRDGRQDDF